jgi:hypothetical protein
LKPTEKEFRTARRKQLEKWQEEHPSTRKSASQHLHAPGKKAKSATKKAAARKSSPKKKSAVKQSSSPSSASKRASAR